MRVAVLVPNFVEFSGDARVAELQARQLAERGNYVAVFALAADIRPKGVDVFVFGMPKSLFWQRIYRLFFPLNVFVTFNWLWRSRDFDLVIAHLYPMTWLAFSAKLFHRVNYVFWFHGIEEPQVFTKMYEKIYMKLHIFLTKITTLNVDRAISVSFFARKKLEEYTGLQSEVVYNKADPQRFFIGLDGSKVRQMYDIGDAPTILYVGRLAPQKGVHLLIKAFMLLKKQMPDARLMLVGDPTFKYYFGRLKEMSNSSVIFAGHVSSRAMPYYYAMCDVFATCSLWENCNLPVLEAQACGKPVVAFDIDAFKEVASQNIVLVEKLNIERFSVACVEMIRKARNAR